MNTLLNSLKYVPKVVNPFMKIGGCGTRGLKSNLKIKWVRPEKIPSTDPSKSGDLGIDNKISPHDLAHGYDKSEELKNAPDIVKKLFTLDFLPIQETIKKNREKTRETVMRHHGDYKSPETAVALMTSGILYLQEHMVRHPRNRACKADLKELIDKRKKYLTCLRRWDYKRFEWLLEKLNLIYKPHPELWVNPTRKDSLRKLTTRHCDKIREEKLNAYKVQLEGQQKEFYNDKAEKLAFIRAEEIACGLEPTISEEEIAVAQKKAAEFQ